MSRQDILNQIYQPLEQRRRELIQQLRASGFKADSAYHNGHYHRENGEYKFEFFPIPVISIPGCCDIEIGLDGISISAKLTRAQALAYDYDTIKAYNYEAFGVEDYLSDYYLPGMSQEKLRHNIRLSGEQEIGFAFLFSHNAPELAGFAKLLQSEGFYY